MASLAWRDASSWNVGSTTGAGAGAAATVSALAVSAAAGDGLRAVLMRPWTGRTHQLRVAMKALGAPLLGDTRYGGAASERLHLHAWALSFVWQGTARCFQAPLPDAGAFQHPVMRAQAAAWWPPEQIVMPAPSPAQLARIGADQEDC